MSAAWWWLLAPAVVVSAITVAALCHTAKGDPS